MFDQIPPYGENLVKISQVDPEIICLKGLKMTGCTPTTLLNKNYTQCSQIITDKLLNHNGDIAIFFGMPGLRIKVNSPILPILTLKLVAMTTSLEPSRKGGQIGILRSNTYHTMKTS